MDKNKEKEVEERIKIYVLDYLKDKNLVEYTDNIVFADKAFKCSSIIRWCARKHFLKLITTAGVEKHYKAMDRFIKGEIDLAWNSKGYVEVKQLHQKALQKSNNDF